MFGSTNKTPAPAKKLANLAPTGVNSNQQAVPAPYLAGRRRVALVWIAPAYNQITETVKQKVGKGDSTTVGHIYYVDLPGLICASDGRRPLDRIFRHIIENETMWTNASGLLRDADFYEPVTIAKFATTRIYWGYWLQPIDTLVLTPRGATPTTPGYNGRDPSTWPNANNATLHPGTTVGHYDRHPRYAGDAYIVGKKVKCGQDRTQAPNWEVEVARGVPWFGGGGLDSDARGVNIAGLFYEAFTDDVIGKGLPDSALVQSTFEAERADCDDFRLSVHVTTQQDFKAYLTQLAEYGDFWMRRNGAQIELGRWKRGDIDLSALPHVRSDDLVGEPDLEHETWDDCLTKVTVLFNDREHDFTDQLSKPCYNPHVFRITDGQPREEQLQRPWITDQALSNQMATEYGTMRGRPTSRGTIGIKRERAKALGLHRPGGLFVLDWATRGVSLVMRNTKVSWPAARDGVATLTVEKERGIWPARYVQPPAASPGNFVVSVPAITNARVFELPSGLKDSSAMQITLLAQRPSPAVIGFRTYVSADGGSTYDPIGEDNNFAVFGQFTADYGSSNPDDDTTVGLTVELFGVDTISTQTETQRNDNNLLLFAYDEVMSVGQVVALGGGIFRVYVRRARFGTPKRDHQSSNTAWFTLRSNLVRTENRNFVPGSTRSFKLQPFTQASELALSAIGGTLFATSPYTFSSAPAVNAIANLALTTDWDKTAQDTVIARIGATWDAVREQDVAGYEVGIKPSSAVAYQTRSVGAVLITEWTGLLPGVSYDVRVRAINEHSEPGLWSLSATIVASAGLAKPTFDISGGAPGSANESQTFTADFDFYFWGGAPSDPYGAATGAMRYTTDGSDDTASSPIMAQGGHITVTGDLTIKCSIYNGTKAGPRRTVTLTKIVDTSVWTNLPPPYFYHVAGGTRGAAGYNVKVQSRSPIATVTMVSVDGGAFFVYANTTIAMSAGGSIEAYDDAPGIAFPSGHEYFYNVAPTADPRFPPGTNVP